MRLWCPSVLLPDWDELGNLPSRLHFHQKSKMPSQPRMSYEKAGVSLSVAERLVHSIRLIARKTNRRGLLAGVGGFSGLFDLKPLNYRHPVLVSSTDGVGTKLKIAFMMDVHHTVGIDLVAMGVNDILTQGAEPLFFLDYFATGKLNPNVTLQVIRGVAEGCRIAGCTLIGGETAEMPSFYRDGEYDLAGFAVGAVEKKKIPDSTSVVAGDLLVGLPSSGLHSNGFSLARKVLLENRKLKLNRKVPELRRTLGEELLEPTRIYRKIILSLLRRYSLKGLAHVTGGGIPGNLSRILPPTVSAWIRRTSWPSPPIFELIQRCGRLSQAEMDRTFNNGLGMILVVGKKNLGAVERSLRGMRESYFLIGEIRPRGRDRVHFTS